MRYKRLSAYTLMELVVAMLVSGIVIGAAFSVFSMIINIHKSFIKRQEQTSEVQLFDRLMKKDFRQARYIRQRLGSILFYRASDTIHYRFDSTMVTRRQGSRADTLRLVLKDLTIVPADIKSQSQPPDEERLLSKIELNIALRNSYIFFTYDKHYSSSDLIDFNNAGD